MSFKSPPTYSEAQACIIVGFEDYNIPPLTFNNTPVCLLPVNNRPLIFYLLYHYKMFGYNNFVILCHDDFAEQMNRLVDLTAEQRDNSCLDDIVYVVHSSPTLTSSVAALIDAYQRGLFNTENIIIINSCLFTCVPPSLFLNAHRKTNATLTVLMSDTITNSLEHHRVSKCANGCLAAITDSRIAANTLLEKFLLDELNASEPASIEHVVYDVFYKALLAAGTNPSLAALEALVRLPFERLQKQLDDQGSQFSSDFSEFYIYIRSIIERLLPAFPASVGSLVFFNPLDNRKISDQEIDMLSFPLSLSHASNSHASSYKLRIFNQSPAIVVIAAELVPFLSDITGLSCVFSELVQFFVDQQALPSNLQHQRIAAYLRSSNDTYLLREAKYGTAKYDILNYNVNDIDMYQNSSSPRLETPAGDSVSYQASQHSSVSYADSVVRTVIGHTNSPLESQTAKLDSISGLVPDKMLALGSPTNFVKASGTLNSTGSLFKETAISPKSSDSERLKLKVVEPDHELSSLGSDKIPDPKFNLLFRQAATLLAFESKKQRTMEKLVRHFDDKYADSTITQNWKPQRQIVVTAFEIDQMQASYEYGPKQYDYLQARLANTNFASLPVTARRVDSQARIGSTTSFVSMLDNASADNLLRGSYSVFGNPYGGFGTALSESFVQKSYALGSTPMGYASAGRDPSSSHSDSALANRQGPFSAHLGTSEPFVAIGQKGILLPGAGSDASDMAPSKQAKSPNLHINISDAQVRVSSSGMFSSVPFATARRAFGPTSTYVGSSNILSSPDTANVVQGSSFHSPGFLTEYDSAAVRSMIPRVNILVSNVATLTAANYTIHRDGVASMCPLPVILKRKLKDDNYDDVKAINSSLSRGLKISPAAVLRDSTINAYCVIKAKSVVEGCIFGNNVTIAENCRLTNCIVLDHVRVEPDCVLSDCFICSQGSIGESSTLVRCVLGEKCRVKPHSDQVNAKLA